MLKDGTIQGEKHAASYCKVFDSVKVYFSGKASAEVCLENMKQIAEHAYFICLSGLVWSGRSSKSGFTSFINTHTHTHMLRNTQTRLADSSAVKSVQVNAQGDQRQRVSQREIVEAR